VPLKNYLLKSKLVLPRIAIAERALQGGFKASRFQSFADQSFGFLGTLVAEH
jgi:hypothetical protein